MATCGASAMRPSKLSMLLYHFATTRTIKKVVTKRHAKAILSAAKCAEFWSLGQWLGRWSLWQLGYADNMTRSTADMSTPYNHDTLACSDSDADESYNPFEGTENDSSADDSDEHSLGCVPLPCDVSINSEDAEEEH